MKIVGIRLNDQELYVRELTETESALVSNKSVTPMLMCPDKALIKDSNEEIFVSHSFYIDNDLHYGFEYSDGKYSTLPSKDIELINPKFNWDYVAKQNEKR